MISRDRLPTVARATLCLPPTITIIPVPPSHPESTAIRVPQVSLPNVDDRLVDSQLYEPIPFKTALDDGCTHVLVLRSRPDGGSCYGVLFLAVFSSCVQPSTISQMKTQSAVVLCLVAGWTDPTSIVVPYVGFIFWGGQNIKSVERSPLPVLPVRESRSFSFLRPPTHRPSRLGAFLRYFFGVHPRIFGFLRVAAMWTCTCCLWQPDFAAL